MQPCVYMMASSRNGTLYIGVTSDLLSRVWQHKNNVVEGFTEKYEVHQLIWYEPHENMESAILREKALKKWEAFARSNFKPKNLPPRHPRESGDPSKRLIKMDSHFRGNDGF